MGTSERFRPGTEVSASLSVGALFRTGIWHAIHRALLKAIGASKSVSETLETGLGVPFAEFEQKWQTWLKQCQ
jgi:hypothetical protein